MLEADTVRDNIRDNTHSVKYVLCVQLPGRTGRSGAKWTHMTLGSPG